MADTVETIKYIFEGEVNPLQKAANKAVSITKSLSRAFAGLTGLKVGDWFSDATKQSIAYVENLNLFTVAMGDAIAEGTAFVDTMQELYGMDPNTLMQHVGNFYQLADAIDMPTEAATTMSLSLTKATNDIASLFNQDVTTVFENLASGMQGMSRAVRKYGMDIRTTTLQQTALTLGIHAQVETMSEANRMGLRYLTMMKQVSNATGDFARTIETPANQLRILQEQMSQLGRAIGMFIIGPLGTAVQYINGFVMAIRTALTFIASLLGLTEAVGLSFDSAGTDTGAEAIEGVGAAADKSAKKLKKFLAPFDELTILQDKTSESSGGGVGDSLAMDPAIADAIAKMSYDFEQIRMKANQVRDAILEFLGFEIDAGQIIRWDSSQFEENLINKFPQWTKTIRAVFDNWSAIADAFKAVLNSIGGVLSIVIARLKALFSGVDWDASIADFINNLSTNLYKLSAWIDEHAEGLADLVMGLGALAIALAVLPGVTSVLSTIGSLLGPVITAFSTLSVTAVAAIAAVVAVVTYLWATSETFRNSVTEAVQSLGNLIKDFWNSLLGPILKNVAISLKDLWQSAVRPVIEQIMEIIGHLIEIVMNLWSTVLAPLLDFVVQRLGPKIADVFNSVWNTVSGVVESIIRLFEGLLQIMDGFLEFLAGVFSVDVAQVGRGISNIFIGVVNTIISAVEFCVNAVAGLVNILVSLVYNTVIALINSILSAAEVFADLLGKNISLKITSAPPKIPTQRWARFPELAQGGVVTSPTMALIGEGRYDEAVIPLGNSPQLNELVNRIAAAVKQDRSAEKPVHVHVYVDGREITTSQNNMNRMYGRVQQNG